MSDVTQILSAIEGGDAQAAEQLLPLVYDELRKLAAARMAQESPHRMIGRAARNPVAQILRGGIHRRDLAKSLRC